VRAVIRALALVVFLVVVFQLFRYAMGLRDAKRQRERQRAAEEGRGRRVLAEIPLSDAEVVLLVEDESSLVWGGSRLLKADVAGGRLLLNGGILREFSRRPGLLPPPAPPEDFDGHERWEVAAYTRGGGVVRIPCGTLREGVSREIAGRVYEALERAGAGASSQSSSGRASSG
jgi:hypothetical protein